MSWAFWLTAAVVVSVLFALLGVRPKGARPVGSSRMMAVARVVLVIVAVIILYLVWRARAGG
jgi:hypothetical protein